MKPIASFICPGLFFALLLVGSSPGRAQVPVPPSRHLELVSYGTDVGEVRVVVGSLTVTTQVRILPMGTSLDIGPGSKLEIRQKTITPEGKDAWPTVAEAKLPPDKQDFLVALVPLETPTKEGLRYRTVVFGKDLKADPASYTMANVTGVTVLVQIGGGQPPVEIPAWSQHEFKPTTDKRFRALIRVAYHGPENGWKVLRNGVVALLPDQAIYGNIIFAAKGMGELAEGDVSKTTQPVVMIMESVRQATTKPL